MLKCKNVLSCESLQCAGSKKIKSGFFSSYKNKYAWSLVPALLGPSKMRTNQKTHQLKQYKTRGHVGLFSVAIKVTSLKIIKLQA